VGLEKASTARSGSRQLSSGRRHVRGRGEVRLKNVTRSGVRSAALTRRWTSTRLAVDAEAAESAVVRKSR